MPSRDRSEDGPPEGDPSRSLEARLRDIDALLSNTAEIPLDRESNRWIGEAHAVIRDLVANTPDRETVRQRCGHVVDLLESVDETGDVDADTAVAEALALAREIASTPE